MTAKQEKPLISIIVPVYNIMEYLPRCVKSVCAQTYTNLEILLVDDGSTDGTGRLCDELALEDERIRVFHRENGGSSAARNLGLANAIGRYVGFVDSDDYISPDMYERLYEGILAGQPQGVKIAQIGRDETDEQGKRLSDICEVPERDQIIGSEEFLKELLMHRGDCSFCTKLVDRELFKAMNFPEGVLNEDFHLLVRMLEHTKGIISLPGRAYHVFYRIGSNSRKADKESFSRVYGDCVDNADMVAELTKRRYPGLCSVALRFGVFQRLEYLLHIPISQMRSENGQYADIVRWMRKNTVRALFNRQLTVKNKIYMVLFALAPRGIRVLHKKIKNIP